MPRVLRDSKGDVWLVHCPSILAHAVGVAWGYQVEFLPIHQIKIPSKKK